MEIDLKSLNKIEHGKRVKIPYGRIRLFNNYPLIVPVVPTPDPVFPMNDKMHTVYTIGSDQYQNRFGYQVMTSISQVAELSTAQPDYILTGDYTAGTGVYDSEGICWVSACSGVQIYAFLEERPAGASTGSPVTTFKYTLFTSPSEGVDLRSWLITPPVDPFWIKQRTVSFNSLANRGPEGITWDPYNDQFYIAVEGQSSLFPNDSAYGLYTLDPNTNIMVKLQAATDALSAFGMKDLTDVYFDRYFSRNLFILSDESGTLVRMTTGESLVESLTAAEWLPANGAQVEGIAFSRYMDRMYVSSEPNLLYLYTRPLSADITLSNFTYATSAEIDYIGSDLSSITIEG